MSRDGFSITFSLIVLALAAVLIVITAGILAVVLIAVTAGILAVILIAVAAGILIIILAVSAVVHIIVIVSHYSYLLIQSVKFVTGLV